MSTPQPPPSPVRTALLVVTALSLIPAGLMLLVIGISQDAGPFGFALVLAVLLGLPGLLAGLAALVLRGRPTPRAARRAALAAAGLLVAGMLSLPLESVVEELRHETSADRVERTATTLLRDCGRTAVTSTAGSDASADLRSRLEARALACFQREARGAITEAEGWSVGCGAGATDCTLQPPSSWYGPRPVILISTLPDLDRALRGAARPPLVLGEDEELPEDAVLRIEPA